MYQIATIIIKAAWIWTKSLEVVIKSDLMGITIKDGWTNTPLVLSLLSSLFIRLFISINYDNYWNFVNVQHPWWWLLGFDPCTSILDDDYWNLIHVQASFMMMIGIWFMSKHPWWWLLEFDSCSSILDGNFIDFTRVQKALAIVVSFGKVIIWMHSNLE